MAGEPDEKGPEGQDQGGPPPATPPNPKAPNYPTMATTASPGIPVRPSYEPPQAQTNIAFAIGPPPPPPDPLIGKYTETHIASIIENTNTSDWRKWVTGLAEKAIMFVLAASTLYAVYQIVFALIDKGQYDTAEKVIIGFITFLSGLGLGAGAVALRSRRDKPKDD